jgi:ribosomal protein S18 acetylase RimI-like enzyme
VTGFDIQPLGPSHDRATFACGEASLDDYLKTKARKEHELGFSAAFVMTPVAHPSVIAGYYTLSALSVEVTGIPEPLRKRFPRYPVVPVTLLGRLARSLDYQGQGVGEMLLIDALNRAQSAADSVGSHAVVVDPIDERARAFYQAYGFLPLVGTRRLFLSMATIKMLNLDGTGAS